MGTTIFDEKSCLDMYFDGLLLQTHLAIGVPQLMEPHIWYKQLPSRKLSQKTMEITFFFKENSLFLWPFSVAMLNCQSRCLYGL